MKLKVLVVEDEKIFRDYLVGLLDWKRLDMEIAGVCRHGAEAIKLLEEQEIHIALVDISMPVMDGITFSTLAKEKNKYLKIIFLTGHNEFEYARSAIKLGVSDYILKPFNEKELESVVYRVKKEIEQERQDKNKLDRQKKEDLIRYMDELTSDGYVKREDLYQDFLEILHQGQKIEAYRLIIIEEDYFDELWESVGQNNLWRNTLLNMLEEIYERFPHLCFCNNSGKIILLLLFETVEQSETYPFEELSRLCRIVRQKLKFSITIGISNTFQELLKSNIKYDHVIGFLSKKMVLGHGKILWEEEEQLKMQDHFYPKIPSEQIREAFLDGDCALLKQIISQINENMNNKEINLDIVYLVYSQLIAICLSIITERGENISEIYGSDFLPFSKLRQLCSTKDIMNYVVYLYEQAILVLSKANYTRTRTLAKEAGQYILLNYQDSELSVENVAKHLYINSSYLRAAFKKEYGMTVSNFIFKTRMEKAHELIPKGNFKLTEIAGMVGISDGAYFSKCFKKQYGLSPSEFANLQNNM